MQTNSLNTPYVKQFDANGRLTNSIERSYVSYYENRRMRRLREKGIVRKNNKASKAGSWVQKISNPSESEKRNPWLKQALKAIKSKIKFIRHIA